MGGFFGDGGLGLGSISDLLSGLLDIIIAVLDYIWNVLVAVANFLWQAILDIASFAVSLFDRIKSFFQHIWEVVFKKIIGPLVADYQKLHVWLQHVLGPLLSWIQRIRIWYVKHILPIITTVQNILSTIRVMLEVFRLLGAKWAAKLDADIQKIQGYITQFNQLVLGNLNKISTILGLIVDPGMLIRTSAFGGTLWNNLGLVKQAAGYGSARPLFPDEKATAKSMSTAAYGPGNLATAQSDGTLIYDPAVKLVDDSMTHQMRTLGIAP
jgi:hypothetical protein